MEKKPETKRSIMFYYDHMEEIFLLTVTLIMVGSIFLQVIMRYVFNNSLSWSEELGRYMFIWMSWVGVSLGAKYGQHIKIEVLVNKFPFKTRHIINIFSELIVIAINFVCVYYGYFLIKMLLNQGLISAPLQINQAWGYAAVPVGCAMMILRDIQAIKASIKCIREGEPPEIPEAAAVEPERGLS